MKVFKKKETTATTTTTLDPEVAAAAAEIGLLYNPTVDFNRWTCPDGMIPNCVPQKSGMRVENIRPARMHGMVVFVAMFADFSGAHCASQEEIILSLVPDKREAPKTSSWEMSEEEKARLNAELDEDGAWE